MIIGIIDGVFSATTAAHSPRCVRALLAKQATVRAGRDPATSQTDAATITTFWPPSHFQALKSPQATTTNNVQRDL